MKRYEPRHPTPAMDLSAAAYDLPPARIVLSDDATAEPLAHMYVTETGGAIRTLLGSAHRHWFEGFPSCRTGGWQPVESEGEHMLAMDGECEFKVLDYQAQALRLRYLLDGERVEWIVDHLRQLRDGTIEAIEVKPYPEAMDAAYRRKMFKAGEILGRLGWRVKVCYHEEIRGGRARQENRSFIAGDGDIIPCIDDIASFDRLMARGPETTFGELCAQLSGARFQARALAHSMIVAGRVDFDMDAVLQPNSPVTLHAPRVFNSWRRTLTQ